MSTKPEDETEKEHDSDGADEENDEVRLTPSSPTIFSKLFIKIIFSNFLFNKIFIEKFQEEERGQNKFGINNGTNSSRTVTLPMLMAANMLQPGKSAMTIEYLVIILNEKSLLSKQ